MTMLQLYYHSLQESCTENQQAICRTANDGITEFKDCRSGADGTYYDCFYQDPYSRSPL